MITAVPENKQVGFLAIVRIARRSETEGVNVTSRRQAGLLA
jgi:hypothetical protein